MKNKKLLFVTQFEELWFDALRSLMDLRKTGFNHVVFLHVIERDKVAMHRGKGYLKDEEIKLREMANVRFIDWAESLFEQGMEVGAYIVVGNPLPKIISTAAEEDVDLIVTGRHKRGKFEELYGGSETLEILERTSTPVLVYKYMLPSGKVNEKPFERPLLTMDWSPASEKAADYLLSFKDILKKVIVIHVIGEKEFKSTSAMEIQAIRKENRQKLERVCSAFEKEGIEAEPHLYVGGTFEQIEKAASEREASMIVAGTTGKSPLKEIFLGSVAKKLTKHSMLPSLLVPASVKL
ncbi:MAG: universal stress protein [Deltaproteobacteria bacterium]|nr:universal stress protein [Deltaproteobacteria bacterium]MBW2595218.1 universal stress protein [Deltaproteobacteria bacterium]MBW2649834.1 universal stress protein [Deltaproteobacteria bacterium]